MGLFLTFTAVDMVKEKNENNSSKGGDDANSSTNAMCASIMSFWERIDKGVLLGTDGEIVTSGSKALEGYKDFDSVTIDPHQIHLDPRPRTN